MTRKLKDQEDFDESFIVCWSSSSTKESFEATAKQPNQMNTNQSLAVCFSGIKMNQNEIRPND